MMIILEFGRFWTSVASVALLLAIWQYAPPTESSIMEKLAYLETAVLLMDRARRAPSETGLEIKIGAVLEERSLNW